ncbi:MAG: hypothetical protein NVS4B11_27090 [Ktedonobacteraceae bacterium]
MARQRRIGIWYPLLLLLAFSLQGCLGFGGDGGSSSTGNFKTVHTDPKGHTISINQDSFVFKGTIYFTQGRNIFALDGKRNLHQITADHDFRDPVVSPNGKWIAAIMRYKNYSDLVYKPIQGGTWTILRTGQGKFYQDGPFIKNTYYWYAQPMWSADSAKILFLSDLEKEQWYSATKEDAPLLDLQVFMVPLNNPASTPQDVAYADYGDGGDRDAMYRPGHPDQVVYTHYTYDKTGTKQVIQVYLENANAIANNPGRYSPGVEGSGLDPSVALTPGDGTVQNIQPAFSPDGNSLAYVRRENNGQMSLYVMPLPTQDVTSQPNNPTVVQQALAPYKQSSLLLTQQFASQPVWSPDGKQIAYLNYTNNEYNIWLASLTVDAKTGAYKIQGSPVQLTSGGIDGDSRPFWTP